MKLSKILTLRGCLKSVVLCHAEGRSISLRNLLSEGYPEGKY
jgi:hypothetical protein